MATDSSRVTIYPYRGPHMIRQPWGDDKWLLTPQAEHARIAGLIAAAWLGSGRAQGNGLLTAITHHEDGWSETDAAPALNSGGDPRSEGETPLKALMPIWDRTTKSLVSEGHLFAAALVASYLGRELRHHVDFEQSAPRAVVEAGRFVGELKRLSARLRAEDFAQATAAHPEGSEASEMPTGNNRAITPEAFDEDLRLLAACDRPVDDDLRRVPRPRPDWRRASHPRHGEAAVGGTNGQKALAQPVAPPLPQGLA